MAIFVFSKMTEKKLFQLTTNSFPNNIKAKFHVTTHTEYILTTKHVFYIKHTPDNMRISYKKKRDKTSCLIVHSLLTVDIS